MSSAGGERRPTLALLAGLLCDDEIWRETAQLLAEEAEVEIFCFPMFSSIERMAAHVVDAIGGPFAVAGHSMGGRVALEIVRSHPQRISGLALLNTGIHPPAEHEPASRGHLVALARERGMTRLARAWLPPLMGKSTDPRGAIGARLTKMVERGTPESFALQTEALLSRPDHRAVLPHVHVPVLLLSGTLDAWSPPAQHEEMRQLCPDAELVVIDRAGHMAPAEQPALVAAALRTWLASVNRPRTPPRD
jgi:pimeloyl-ACP methyl ester carboxylesterase